jgi:hypothetical protein
MNNSHPLIHINQNLDANIHGPAHSSVAGSWRREGQTSDSPYCAQWYGFIPPPTSATTDTNANDPNRRYAYGTFINPYALGCFQCPTCDIDRDPSDCMCKAKSMCGPIWTKLRTGDSSTDDPNMASLAPPEFEQTQGDFGDIAGSPNDPLFVFHHGNVDRIFETWMKFYTSSNARANYFNFPTSEFALGYVYVYMCVYIYIFIHIYIFIYHARTHTYIHAYIIQIYICIYIYMYI